MRINEELENIFKNLEDYSRSEMIVGKPIVVGNITLIPLIEVGLGLGTGGNQGKVKEGRFSAVGVGAKISPSSVLVIRDEQVYALPLKEKGTLDKVVEMLPLVLGKFQNKEEQVNTGG